MKRLLILFVAFAPIWGLTQNDLLVGLLNTSPPTNETIIHQRSEEFVKLLKTKKAYSKSEVRFLKWVINETHRKFLKTYKAYSHFNELFENGYYDCLTGTAFFSYLLQSLQFQYKIIETNYHIFIVIDTKEGKLLLETTDRLFGFKTNPNEVNSCLNKYKENQLSNTYSHKGNYYQYHSSLFREVEPDQLSGLLYFNQAVVAYNSHDWIACADRLQKAKNIYYNIRITELARLLAGSIAISNLNDKLKQELLIQLSQVAVELPILATR